MRLRLLFLPLLFTAFTLQAQTPVINWIKKNGPLGGEIIDMEVDPATGNIFLLDGDNRPYKSTDNGNSWQRITFQNFQPRFEDIEITNNTIFLVGYWELFASIDAGASFQERMTDVSPYEGAQRLKRMPVSGNLVVLTYNGIYSSVDDGVSWTQQGLLNGIDQGYHLAINALDQIFVLKENGLFEVRPFRSNNGGVSFTEMSTGIPAGHHANSLSAENDGAKIYCTTNQEIFASTDGSSWSNIKSASITDLDISDVHPGNSYVEFSADGLGMFFVDNINHKLYSKTLAETDWTLRSSSFPSGTTVATCASAKDFPGPTSATVFFGTPIGVYKTITGGASITENNTGIASLRTEQILADNNNNLFLRTESSQLLKSTDGGNNWTKITGFTGNIEYFTQNNDALFVLDAVNVLHRSYNSGTSWTALTVPPSGFTWAQGIGASKVFAFSSDDLYYSIDNGENWTATPVSISGLPLSYSIYQYDRIGFASEEQMILYIYDVNKGASFYYRIDFTYDAGEAITSAVASEITSIPIPDGDIQKVLAGNGKFYLYDTYSASADRVSISEDGGVSWLTHSVPESDNFFVTKNGYLFFTDGSNNKIQISRDRALTFIETSLPAAVSVWNIEDITLDNSGFAYLAIRGDYLYQSATTIVLPSPPTDLREIGKTATAVALDWEDLNTFDRDIVIERSSDNVNYVVAGQVSGWDTCEGSGNRGYFVDTNLQPGINYTYRIKAKNAAGSSEPTTTLSVTTLGTCTPNIPENRSWSAINSGTEGYVLLGAPKDVGIKHLGGGKYQISDLLIGVDGSSDPEPYLFYESCGQTVVGETGNLNPNGSGTWNGTTLTLKWKSCFDGKTETISLTVNPTDPIPAKPAAPLAYVVSNTSIEVKWAATYYENSYILERSQSPNTGFASIATVNYPATTYPDNGPLIEGTTYYYRITALNGNTTPQASPYSDAVAVSFNRPNFVVADNAITRFNSSITLGSFWADFNNDGLDDYLTMQYDVENQITRPMIFKNLGTGDFEPAIPDVGDTPYFFPSVVDYDNDHYPDLALSGDNERIFDIFKGNGDLTFTKIPTGQLGDLAIIEKEISGFSWADINNDGLPDVLLLNGEDGSFTVYKQNINHSFTKVFQGAPTEDEPLLSIWADYDNDGYQDFLLGNLDGAGGLYHNNGDETFTKTTGNGFDGANYFSAAWGDYNNDGNIDLFCGSVSMNALYKNNGDGTFTKNVSTVISEANFVFSGAWGDYNNDGYLDLMTASMPVQESQSRLFLRDPSVTASVAFKKITTEKINDLSVGHYSAAHADPDQNGQLDLAMSAFEFVGDIDEGAEPANNNFYQNNNVLANWSEVKLNPTSGSTESLGARITLTAGGKTQTREIAASSSLLSRNSAVAHFGLGSTAAITNIQIRWPNGSTQNYPFPPINQILVIDEDVVGPAITTKTPGHTATGVSTTTTLTMVFDENPFPVPGKKIDITKVGDTTPFTSVDADAGIKSGNQVVYTLPVELQGETLYRVTIEAGAFRDRWLNPSAAVGPLEWRFTTEAVADSEPPVIAFETPVSPNIGFGTVNSEIVVTDNIGVSTVVLSIRKISGSAYTDIDLNLAPTGSDTYPVTLSEDNHFDEIGAEFFITATDLAGNSTRYPDATGTDKVYMSYSAAQAAIPSSSLGLGGLKESWKVFAIPFDIPSPNNGVAAIFDELEGKDDRTDFRLITYGTPDKWSEYPDAFSALSRGTGYFINIRDDPGAIELFDLQAPANSRSSLFEIDLKVGWNMIGNPYLTPISWDDVAALNELSGTALQLKTFSNGTYSNDQTLAPYEGGFVLAEAAKTIEIPFQGQKTAEAGRKGVRTLGNDISGESWALPVVIHQAGLTYTLGGIGMAPEASPGIDNFDDVTPPRFIDYLELNFSHPEHIAKRFTREIVPTQQDYTWDFTVDSNLEGMAELTWNNAVLMTSDKDLFLLDVSAQKLVNMKETGSHRFDPKESNSFRIYYGDNLNIAPERAQLGKAYPNPTKGLTTLAFSLPETGGLNQSVSLEIVDALGRTVGTVTQGRFNPGYHEAAFDARHINNGFYTYRLTVRNMKGQTTAANKLIIK